MKLKINFKPVTLDVDTDEFKTIHKNQLFNKDTSYTDFEEWLEKEGCDFLLNDWSENWDEELIDNLKIANAEIQKSR